MRACDPKPGPFTCSDDFHQYLIDVARLPARLTPTFPRNMPIVFTHADLHKSNILVYPPTGQNAPPRVAAILDWHSAGWFPAYWELCKMMWTADPAEDDEIELIMELTGGWQYRDLYDGWCELARRIH
jgi:Ser/Thr protein kinase RdoA (MazF antagonist)